MGLIEIIAAVLVVAWLAGYTLNIGGSLIHLLLVVAIVVFLMRFFRTNTV